MSLESHPQIEPMKPGFVLFTALGTFVASMGVTIRVVGSSSLEHAHDVAELSNGLMAGGGAVALVAFVLGLMLRSEKRS